jgi:hypothetical protein
MPKRPVKQVEKAADPDLATQRAKLCMRVRMLELQALMWEIRRVRCRVVK